VADETPGSCGISVTGAAEGVAIADVHGNFDAVFDVMSPGGATLTAGDGRMQSQPINLMLANNAPTVTVSAQRQANVWVLSGKVTDEAPGGLQVRLSGSKTVAGLTATVQANGTWSVAVADKDLDLRSVVATVADWYALESAAKIKVD
jgi:hypothetical protein